MKKIFTILALAMISVGMWAQMTITANDLDFGNVVLVNGEAEGNQDLHISWTNPVDYSTVYITIENQPTGDCIFSVDNAADDTTWCYVGSSDPYAFDPLVYSYDCNVAYYATSPGNYSCNLHIYDLDWDEDWIIPAEKTITVTLKVTETSTGVENVKAATKAKKIVRNGQVLIIRNGEKYSVMGAKVE